MTEIFEPGAGVLIGDHHSPIMVFSGFADGDGKLQCFWHNDSGYLQEHFFHPDILVDFDRSPNSTTEFELAVGSVVTLGTDHWESKLEMLVIDLDEDVATCLWFIDEIPMTKKIPVAALVVPRAVVYESWEAKVGSMATFAIPNSPSMTIATINDQNAECLWYKKNRELCTGDFQINILVPTPKANYRFTPESCDDVPF